jgi:hypothetical protein
MSRTSNEIIDVDTKQMDRVLRHAEQSLDPEDFELTQAIFNSYAYLSDLVDDKNTSIRKLRRIDVRPSHREDGRGHW